MNGCVGRRSGFSEGERRRGGEGGRGQGEETYTETKIENFSHGKLDVRGVARESGSIEMSE